MQMYKTRKEVEEYTKTGRTIKEILDFIYLTERDKLIKKIAYFTCKLTSLHYNLYLGEDEYNTLFCTNEPLEKLFAYARIFKVNVPRHFKVI